MDCKLFFARIDEKTAKIFGRKNAGTCLLPLFKRGGMVYNKEDSMGGAAMLRPPGLQQVRRSGDDHQGEPQREHLFDK